MKKESNIQSEILLSLSQSGFVVWRVETAGAWVGKMIHRSGDRVTLSNARMIKTGLCKGGADIIGIHKGTGKFIAIEVKTPQGRATIEQQNFIDRVRAAGGCAGICRSADDALQLVAPYLQE